MSIRPVDFNGMIQNTHDVGAMKHQEDQRPALTQQNIIVEMEETDERQMHRVHDKGEAQRDERKFDAREKGSNSYEGDPRKRKKQKKGEEKVSAKREGYSFDVKI